MRAVLVTGGSRGIGAAIARAFAALGDRVAVHYRDASDLAGAVRDCLPGDGHAVVRADLADAEAVRAMVDEAANRLGGLDVLVNNAGVYLAHPVLDGSYDQWQQAWRDTLGVNLIGAANATWCAVRHMVARGDGTSGGRIVNVGSAARSAASRPIRRTGPARRGCTRSGSRWRSRSRRTGSPSRRSPPVTSKPT